MTTQLTRIETNTQTLIKQVKQLSDAFAAFSSEADLRFALVAKQLAEIEAKIDAPPPDAAQELRVTVGDPVPKE